MYQRFTSASSPAQICKDPTDVTISSFVYGTITLPAICRNTSPTPINLSTGFLSNGIKPQARNTSKDNDRFFALQIFLITSAKVLHKSIVLSPN